MKKIILFLIVGLFILSGLKSAASNERIDNGFCLESKDSKITAAPISYLNSQNYKIINDNGKQTNEELKIYSVSYKHNSKDIENYREIKELNKPIERLNSYQTYDYVIITTEGLYSAITSSIFLDWKAFIDYTIKIVNITDNEIASQAGQDLPEKIRNFLISYYQDWEINFVLFVGNHATIPMRYCYPDQTQQIIDLIFLI